VLIESCDQNRRNTTHYQVPMLGIYMMESERVGRKLEFKWKAHGPCFSTNPQIEQHNPLTSPAITLLLARKFCQMCWDIIKDKITLIEKSHCSQQGPLESSF